MKHTLKQNENIEFVVQVLKKFGAKKVTLFGSYSRGDTRPDSDIDVLVEFSKTISLFDLAHIIRIVKEEIRVNLDIVTKNALNPYLIPYIEKDMKVIYSS